MKPSASRLAHVLLAACVAPVAADGRDSPAAWARDALDRAFESAREIEQPFRRAQALANVAGVRAAAGDTARAADEIASARLAADQVAIDALRSWVWHDIAVAQARASEFAGAASTIDLIADAAVRDAALGALALAHASRGDFAAALATAGRTRQGKGRDEVLRDISHLQAAGGELAGALHTARRIVDSRVHATALADLALAHAKDHDVQEAQSLAARIRDAPLRAHALGSVALVQFQAGNLVGARATLERIEGARDRARAWVRIALAQARAGELEEAAATLARVVPAITGARAPREWRSMALCEVAEAAIAAQEQALAATSLREALDAARGIRSEASRYRLLRTIARLRARAGDVPGALEAATATSLPERGFIVRDIAVAQVEAGNDALALEIARGVEEPSARTAVLMGILGARTRMAQSDGYEPVIEAALGAIRHLDDAGVTAGALATLAATRAHRGEETAARSLFADAMAAAAAAPGAQQRAAAYVRIAELVR